MYKITASNFLGL